MIDVITIDPAQFWGGITAACVGIGGLIRWLVLQLLKRIDKSQETYETTLNKVCSTFSEEVAKCHEERAKSNAALIALMESKLNDAQISR